MPNKQLQPASDSYCGQTAAGRRTPASAPCRRGRWPARDAAFVAARRSRGDDHEKRPCGPAADRRRPAAHRCVATARRRRCASVRALATPVGVTAASADRVARLRVRRVAASAPARSGQPSARPRSCRRHTTRSRSARIAPGLVVAIGRDTAREFARRRPAAPADSRVERLAAAAAIEFGCSSRRVSSARNGGRPRDHFVEDHAERPRIRLAIALAGVEALGRQIRRRCRSRCASPSG